MKGVLREGSWRGDCLLPREVTKSSRCCDAETEVWQRPHISPRWHARRTKSYCGHQESLQKLESEAMGVGNVSHLDGRKKSTMPGSGMSQLTCDKSPQSRVEATWLLGWFITHVDDHEGVPLSTVPGLTPRSARREGGPCKHFEAESNRNIILNCPSNPWIRPSSSEMIWLIFLHQTG